MILHDPVRTIGGMGPYDQQLVENRKDVLIYSTPALKEDIEVTGPVYALVYASSSARNTDFTAKLVDVYPDGRAIRICEGIIRADHRNPSVLLPISNRAKFITILLIYGPPAMSLRRDIR